MVWYLPKSRAGTPNQPNQKPRVRTPPNRVVSGFGFDFGSSSGYEADTKRKESKLKPKPCRPHPFKSSLTLDPAGRRHIKARRHFPVVFLGGGPAGCGPLIQATMDPEAWQDTLELDATSGGQLISFRESGGGRANLWCSQPSHPRQKGRCTNRPKRSANS